MSAARQIALFPESDDAAMRAAFARLPRPTGAARVVVHLAMTPAQRDLLDRAMREGARRLGAPTLEGIDAGTPSAMADALCALLGAALGDDA